MTEEPKKLLCPKAGTATSSPIETATSQSFNIPNTMLWMQRNTYEESTVRKMAKLLKTFKKKLQRSRTRRC